MLSFGFWLEIGVGLVLGFGLGIGLRIGLGQVLWLGYCFLSILRRPDLIVFAVAASTEKVLKLTVWCFLRHADVDFQTISLYNR